MKIAPFVNLQTFCEQTFTLFDVKNQLFLLTMVICAAENCKNEGQVFFPKDKTLRRRWEKAMNRKNFKVTNNSKLCYSHFKVTDFEGDSRNSGRTKLIRKLRKGAVPSLFEYLKRESLEKITRETEELMQILHIDAEEAAHIEFVVPVAVNSELRHSTRSHAPPDDAVPSTSTQGEARALSQPCEPEASTSSVLHVVIPRLLLQSYVDQFQYQPTLFEGNTGLDDFRKFVEIYADLYPEAGQVSIRGDILPIDQFYITLMILRRVTGLQEISAVFFVEIGILNSIFYNWIMLIKNKFGSIAWPSRDDIMSHFSETELQFTPRLIIDRIEIQAPAPKKLQKKKVKNKVPTARVVIGSTPLGRVSFCSEAYRSQGERDTVSDLLRQCDQGDIILDNVEKGIVDDHLKSVYAHKRFKIVTPRDVVHQTRVPGLSTDLAVPLETRGCNNVVDRFEILRDMPLAYFRMASDIAFVCCYLHNFILKLE